MANSARIRVYNEIITDCLDISARIQIIHGVDLTKPDCIQGLVHSNIPSDIVLHSAGAVHDALILNSETWITSIPLGAKSNSVGQLLVSTQH